MVRRATSLAASALVLAAFAGRARADTLWIEAKRVVPMNGGPLDGGRIVIRDGKIEAVGKDLARPPFSNRIDATKQVVTPGFVLPLTDLGMPSPPPAPPQEGVRVEMKLDAKASDDFVPRRLEHALLLDSGITVAGLLPLGDAPGIPGEISAISTRTTGDGVVIAPEAALAVVVATHAPWRKAVGEAFDKAVLIRDARARGSRHAAHDDDDKADDDTKAPLQAALAKKRPVVVLGAGLAGWTATRDTLPLAKLDAWIVDSPDLWLDAADVKSSGVKVLTFPVLSRERDTRYPVNRATKWKAAGVPFAFVLASDDVEGAARLRDHVIELVRTGCPADAALAALTSQAAAALGVADKVGSIQPGRRADLLFWSGDPLDPLSRLERVMVAGETIERIAHAGDRDAAGEHGDPLASRAVVKAGAAGGSTSTAAGVRP